MYPGTDWNCGQIDIKDFYSEELRDDYNAIYRTRDELLEILKIHCLKMDFQWNRKVICLKSQN